MSSRNKDTLAGLKRWTCSSLDGNEDGIQNKQSRDVLQSSANIISTDSNLPMASKLNDSVHPPKERVDPDCEEKAREGASLEDTRENEEERNEGTSSSRVSKVQAVHAHDEVVGT
jgi:hypothetical protein